MSILSNSARRIVSDQVRLSGTTATTIVDGKQNGVLIENIRVVNIGAGVTTTVTIDKYDVVNAVAYVLKQAFVFAAAGSATDADVYKIDQQTFLPGGWLLRATRTNGSANDLHVFVTHGRPQSGQTE